MNVSNYRVRLYAIHIPSAPPATLPSNEVREKESAPSSENACPPTKEPTIIPIIIIDFRDMAIMKKYPF